MVCLFSSLWIILNVTRGCVPKGRHHAPHAPGVRKWQQGRSSIIGMCPCLIEDIKQEARLIIAIIQSLDLGKVHYVIQF